MNTKNKKEILDIRKTLRFTPREFNVLNQKAEELDMSFTKYSHDKLVNGKERTTHAKRKMNEAIVLARKNIDQLYDLLESTTADYVSKESIRQLLEEEKKECDAL